ncbi:hypothetical protein [Georgenia alba]|uniref:O-antigen ligase like membrane protein n=1 Tax=Georgenia alba TaxID=2233858 RepID=A0ABW2Q625_9MICO
MTALDVAQQPTRSESAPGDTEDAGREPTRREARWTAISLIALFVGMFLSQKIAGRFAYSNIAQVISLVALLVAFPRAVRPKDVAWVLLAVGGVLVAAFSVYNTYGYQFQPQHTAFFLATCTYLVVWYRATQMADLADVAERAVRKTIVPVFAYLAAQGVLDVAGGLAWTDLGFDDKSHGAVACVVLAFLCLRLLHSPLKLPLSGGFVLLSLLTASRLPLLAAPFFALAFMFEYRRQRRLADTPLKVYLCHTTLALGVGAVIAILRANWDSFHVFTRIGPEASASAQSSTESHLLLISYGLQVKFENLMNFLFGVTPGGYAGTVYRSDVDISDLRGGGGIAAIVDGTAPMHSAHASVFVEFPFPVAILYFALLLWLLVGLLRRNEITLALLLVGFVAVTTLYSSHNEIFFFATLAILMVEASRPRDVPVGEGAESADGSRATMRLRT